MTEVGQRVLGMRESRDDSGQVEVSLIGFMRMNAVVVHSQNTSLAHSSCSHRVDVLHQATSSTFVLILILSASAAAAADSAVCSTGHLGHEIQ